MINYHTLTTFLIGVLLIYGPAFSILLTIVGAPLTANKQQRSPLLAIGNSAQSEVCLLNFNRCDAVADAAVTAPRLFFDNYQCFLSMIIDFEISHF